MKSLLPVLAVYFAGGWASIEVLSFLTQRYGWPDKVIDLSLLGVIAVAVVIVIRRLMHEDHTTRKFQRIEIASYGLLMLALTFFVIKVAQSPGSSHTIVTKASANSIAILPFRQIGNAGKNNEFSDGLIEDMITQIAKIKELRVISRNSSNRFQNSTIPLKEIGRQLGINVLLDGTIRQYENKLRISAQLIEVETETTLWAEEYDRDVSEIFNIQKEVSIRIAEALKMKLTPQEITSISKRGTDNIAAYQLYLHGRNFWDKRTRPALDSAEALYKRAIEIDPNYALAYSGLADCYIFNKKGIPQIDAIPIAKLYIEKALSLDSLLAEAWTSRAVITVSFDYDLKKGKAFYEKAIEINPSYTSALLFFGGTLTNAGEVDRGLSLMKRAFEMDPLSIATNWLIARNLYYLGNYDQAVVGLKKTLAMQPGNPIVTQWLGYALLKTKQYPEALAEFDKLQANNNLSENPKLSRCYALALSGNGQQALKELATIPKEIIDRSPYMMAQLYTALGKFDEAFSKLTKAREIKDFYLFTLKADPTLEPLRKDARFKKALKMINL